MAKYMSKHNLEIVLCSSDVTLITFSACARWPVATVPVGNLSKKNQLWRMFALARDASVDTLLTFISTGLSRA